MNIAYYLLLVVSLEAQEENFLIIVKLMYYERF